MGITSPFKLLYLLFGRCGLFTAFSLYDFTQLAAVGSDQILFQGAGFELHHNIVVIGRNQTVTSFKVSDLHCFSIGQVQDSVLDDTLKLNAVQIFKHAGERMGCEIELRTV